MRTGGSWLEGPCVIISTSVLLLLSVSLHQMTIYTYQISRSAESVSITRHLILPNTSIESPHVDDRSIDCRMGVLYKKRGCPHHVSLQHAGTGTGIWNSESLISTGSESQERRMAPFHTIHYVHGQARCCSFATRKL